MAVMLCVMLFAASGLCLWRTILLIRALVELLAPKERTTADRLRTMRETEERNDAAVRRWSESHERG